MSDTYLPSAMGIDHDGERHSVSANDPANASLFDIADYIASMAGDLSVIARARRLTVLAYLLDMAAAEAQMIARAQAR